MINCQIWSNWEVSKNPRKYGVQLFDVSLLLKRSCNFCTELLRKDHCASTELLVRIAPLTVLEQEVLVYIIGRKMEKWCWKRNKAMESDAPKIHWQRYLHSQFSDTGSTYRVLQTIQMKLILLCVWAERAILGSAETALKFKYEIQIG